MIARADHVNVAEVKCKPDELTITWQNASYSVYSALWLRDNDPAHRDTLTGERRRSLLDLPLEPRLQAADPKPLGHLTLTWEDGAVSLFALSWLRAYDRSLRTSTRPTRMPWLSQAAAKFASCNYAEWLQNPLSREDWLYYAGRDGLAFLRDVPIEDGTLARIAESIGFVRETSRGRIFDVRGSAGAPMHTADPYRDPVPGFAMLHCLHRETGDSLFVDGMAAAERLRAHDMEAFNFVCQTPIRYRRQDAHVDFTVERPMIELSCTGEFRAIYYDDRSIAPLPLKGPRLKKFYAAYRKLAQLLDDKARSVRCSLQPGDVVLFDNTRILQSHSSSYPLQGCYIDADGLYGALAVLTRKRSAHHD